MGPAGPSGILNTYSNTNYSTQYMSPNGWEAVAQTGPVVGGNYLVTATTTALPDTNGDEIDCAIGRDAGPGVFHVFATTSSSNSAIAFPLSLIGRYTISGGDHFYLYCDSTNSDTNSYIQEVTLQAIQLQ
jgi:hypothetical protein